MDHLLLGVYHLIVYRAVFVQSAPVRLLGLYHRLLRVLALGVALTRQRMDWTLSPVPCADYLL